MNMRKRLLGQKVMVLELLDDRLDAAAAGDFRSAVEAVINAGYRDLVINMSKVLFMDSTGLGALVGCLRHAGANGSIALASLSQPVERVLKLTRINRVFQVYDDAAAALSAKA